MTAKVQPDVQETRKAVFLHVGAPKTGTTYLQDLLWKNREALAEDGVRYPLESPKEHLPATWDLRGMSWGGKRDPGWEGAWERLAGRARAWQGRAVVISNELLGGATKDQACRAVESLQPANVHVVFTARDLARQLPSDWQEHLKHRHDVTFRRFVDDLLTLGVKAPHPFGEMFWGLHDPVRVLDNWGAAVPSERIHVVTVPQPGAPQGLLWTRFAWLLELDPARYATAGSSNVSLGQAEAELLRRLNTVIGKERWARQYDQLVRVGLAEGTLAARAEQAKVVLPTRYRARVDELSERIIADIRDAGYNVVGGLDELLPASPRPAARSEVDPSDLDLQEVLDVALETIVSLLERNRPPGAGEGALQQRVAELEQELEQRRRKPVKSLVRDLSETRSAVMRGRVAWWHAVERVRQLRRPRPRG